MSEEKNTTGARSFWIAGGLCGLLAVFAFCWTNPQLWFSREKQPSVPSVPVDFRDILEKHLRGAEEKTQLLAQQGYPAIETIFSKAFDNVPKYAQTILGWSSKWKLVLDNLPGNDKDRHEKYLKEQFERQIFTSGELESAVKQAVRERIVQVRDIENQMLVALRADIEGLPELALFDALRAEAFETRFEHVRAQASELVSEDLSSNIESQLVSLVAGEVMAQVAIRMGVSAGILSTGASSGWATFGVGLVAGVVIDQLVTRIWDWWSEPQEELSYQLAKQLSVVHDLICQGDEKSEGLDGRFRNWTAQRNGIRRQAILNVFFPNETKH
jgi:hypothetical protein